jgi:hypothetical protein
MNYVIVKRDTDCHASRDYERLSKTRLVLRLRSTQALKFNRKRFRKKQDCPVKKIKCAQDKPVKTKEHSEFRIRLPNERASQNQEQDPGLHPVWMTRG